MDNHHLDEYNNNNSQNQNRDNNHNNNNNNSNKDGRQGPGGNNNRPNIIAFVVTTIVCIILLVTMTGSLGGSSQEEITYNEFLDYLEADMVETVQVSDSIIYLQLKDESTETSTGSFASYYYSSSQTIYKTAMMEDYDTLSARLREADVDFSGTIASTSGTILTLLLSYILPIVLVWGAFYFIMRRMGGAGGAGGGLFNMGKNTAKVYNPENTSVTFADVAGEDEAKESLVEVVDFLHNPAKYSGIGARLPKGALLVGPPGTGKTLLAKAVAGEAKVPFFSLTGSNFVEMYVGMGASRVRSLFEDANKNAPCIIFIDEIDAIGRSRDSRYGGGDSEREQTLNQLLSEMDGFDSSKGIFILAATNRPEILDKALLRPGRLDRHIVVERPDLKGRVEILKVHAKGVKLDETVDFREIALATSGAVGSDLANMINEAAINAVKEGREYVSQKDLFGAVEQVLVGKEKKDRIMSQEERRIVSYHEVGHALITALQKNSEPVQKITIVPRTMGALGYVMQVPEEEKYLNSREELLDRLVELLGGRAAEELVFGSITTGASNDIEQATQIARSMITQYGMSDRFGLICLETVESQYLSGNKRLMCADSTAAMVDEEVMKVLKECYQKALDLLRDNRDVMDKIAEYLIEKETITGKEFMKIYRELKGIPEPEKSEEDRRQELMDQLSDDLSQMKQSSETALENGLPSASSQEGGSAAPTSQNQEEQEKSSFQRTLDQQTLRQLKDAEQQENAPTRGRFSGADYHTEGDE
ncbi:MAG: ATP-dependent zinc metalloprotease FtsH [Lachnospiraceae bacterium]|nr:ATP-dependent zinc metalloprotease FtsH [Lachnospiraceae bacterium]